MHHRMMHHNPATRGLEVVGAERAPRSTIPAPTPEVRAMIDSDRRTFLRSCAAIAAAPALGALDASVGAAGPAPSVFGKPMGLQLYSLREHRPKDVPVTLAKIRAMGFEEVEGGDTYGMSVDAFKGALTAAGLKQV